jgi:hypothetical protein
MFKKYIIPVLGKALIFGCGVWWGYANTPTINSIKEQVSPVFSSYETQSIKPEEKVIVVTERQYNALRLHEFLETYRPYEKGGHSR